MIHIRRINQVHPKEFDDVYAIVRSMNTKSPWIKQLPELSPSQELFNKYKHLSDIGGWNQTSFNKIFVPQFLSEISNYTSMLKLYEVAKKSKEREIALVCFCTDEAMCHRSIIAGLLQSAGVRIKTASGRDYSYYGNMLSLSDK